MLFSILVQALTSSNHLPQNGSQIYSFIFIYNHSERFFCQISYLCAAIRTVCYLNFKKI